MPSGAAPPSAASPTAFPRKIPAQKLRHINSGNDHSVLYHMRHPLLALEKAASVCSDLLILETHIDAMNEARPAMIFYPGRELADDPQLVGTEHSLC